MRHLTTHSSLSLLPLLSLALGVAACGGGAGEAACQEENHCIRVDGEVQCEDGFTWENAADPENYNCVAEQSDPCESEGLYNDGICDRTCLNPDPDCGDDTGDGDGDIGDGDGDIGDGDGDIGDGDGDGDIQPPDPTHPEGPRILELSSNVTALDEGESIIITAIVTDPNGIDDLIGGSLVDAVSDASYGSFATSASEGSYSITISWWDLNQVRPIDFVSSGVRVLRARFFDVAGHKMSMDVEVSLDCDGSQACDGACGEARCGGSCVDDDFESVDNCGSCGNTCAEEGICDDGQCTCPEWAPTLCGGVCVDTSDDPDNCGACGNGCASNSCGSGLCLCESGGQCGGGDVCVYDDGAFRYGDTCFDIGGPQLGYSSTPQQGAAMLEVEGLSVPVCLTGSSNVPEVMCRQLYGPDAIVDVNASPDDITLDSQGWANVSCSGTETSVQQCELELDSYCGVDFPVWVACMGGGSVEPDPDPDPTGGDEWTCNEGFYGTNDGCDCGCGIPDPDCGGGTTTASCEYFGNCSDVANVDPSDITQCL